MKTATPARPQTHSADRREIAHSGDSAASMPLSEAGEKDATIASLRAELTLAKQRERDQRSKVNQLTGQLNHAAALQRDLLGRTPAVTGLNVRTIFRPAGPISGDMYTVTRLDNDHIGITMIDATGHDLAAAVLAMLVGRSMASVANANDGQCPLRPDEVLMRAHADVARTDFEDCLFATAICAVYNERTRVVRLARAGAPYPVLLRSGQPATIVKSKGSLLGPLTEPHFEVVEVTLGEGDTLIFHTDGLAEVIDGDGSGVPSIDIENTAWLRSVGHATIYNGLSELQARLDRSDACGKERDDVTVVTLTATAVVKERSAPAAGLLSTARAIQPSTCNV